MQLKIFISIFFLLFTTIFSSGCSTITETTRFPQERIKSFVKVEKLVQFEICDPDPSLPCLPSGRKATGSGAVVASHKQGAFVLTAGHVCSSYDLARNPAVKNMHVTMEVLDVQLKRYGARIISVDEDIDTCMLFVVGAKMPPVPISAGSPKNGDEAYNIAAPMGIMHKNLVPLLEGFYFGVDGNRALYSIPAIGGSSGSPIFNHKGHLIGMIHSVNRYFPVISVSPPTDALRKFIWQAIKESEVSTVKPFTMPQNPKL